MEGAWTFLIYCAGVAVVFLGLGGLMWLGTRNPVSPPSATYNIPDTTWTTTTTTTKIYPQEKEDNDTDTESHPAPKASDSL